MKKTKRRMPKLLRTAAIAAVMTMALAVTAGAVDWATNGGLFATLRQVWSDGYMTRYEAVDENGNQLSLSIAASAYMEKTEDGRLVLHAAGEEMEISERLEEAGAYHYEKALEERTVEVDVSGSCEDWALTETVTEADGTVYANSSTSEGVKMTTTIVTDSEAGADGGGTVYSGDFVATTRDGVLIDTENPRTLTAEDGGTVTVARVNP